MENVNLKKNILVYIYILNTQPCILCSVNCML